MESLQPGKRGQTSAMPYGWTSVFCVTGRAWAASAVRILGRRGRRGAAFRRTGASVPGARGSRGDAAAGDGLDR
ncbi:hypothetical protein [Streptosporangium oxazolinicum]|uniref:hypothetical protein n=1 Tax=Streptosporangium oxazolinicum TaxID=909287 RepID=UPI0031EE329B